MKYFAAMADHRHPCYITHPLPAIVGITIGAVICGAADWYAVEDYGWEKQGWLGQFLDLSQGIPSHDTFNLFFQRVDATALGQCFEKWVSEVATLAEGRIISVDGKTFGAAVLLKSSTKAPGSFIHMVSAWCSESRLVLGQQQVNDKSNEITAIPELLDLLVIKGCLATIDAMGCQIKIAEKIVAKEAHYLLAVKENQAFLLDDIKEAFSIVPAKDTYKQSNVGHGRVETRLTAVIGDTDWICRKEEWKSLHALIKVEGTRYNKKTQKQESSERCYISGKRAAARYFQLAVRTHWQVGNNLHRTPDVIFGEDDSKKRAAASAPNFSLISKVALNMIQHHKDTRKRGAKQISIKGKRKMAGWNNSYLLEILLTLNYQT